MNRQLGAEQPLDDVLTCYHDDVDDCGAGSRNRASGAKDGWQVGKDLDEYSHWKPLKNVPH